MAAKRTINKYKNSKSKYNDSNYQDYLKKYKSQQVMAHRKGLKMKKTQLSPLQVHKLLDKGLTVKQIAETRVRKTKYNYNYYTSEKEITYETYLKNFKTKLERARKYNPNLEVEPYDAEGFKIEIDSAKNDGFSGSAGMNKLINKNLTVDYEANYTYSRKYALKQLNNFRKYDKSITINDIMYRSEKFKTVERQIRIDIKMNYQNKLNELFKQRDAAPKHSQAREDANYEIRKIYETFYGSN